LENVPHGLIGHQLAILASQTAGYSGADIEELVTDAKRRAARRDAQEVSFEYFLTAGEFELDTGEDNPKSADDIESPDSSRVEPSDDTRFDDPGLGFQ
jgi:SpoVK/Ycf46/Vps4 family AAA+-type ATPase